MSSAGWIDKSINDIDYHEETELDTKSKQVACDVCNEIEDLKDIVVVGFETILGIAYKAGGNKEKRKALKALYKEFCSPKIRQGVIPKTLAEFLDEEE